MRILTVILIDMRTVRQINYIFPSLYVFHPIRNPIPSKKHCNHFRELRLLPEPEPTPSKKGTMKKKAKQSWSFCDTWQSAELLGSRHLVRQACLVAGRLGGWPSWGLVEKFSIQPVPSHCVWCRMTDDRGEAGPSGILDFWLTSQLAAKFTVVRHWGLHFTHFLF
jgi:hypothetical protein